MVCNGSRLAGGAWGGDARRRFEIYLWEGGEDCIRRECDLATASGLVRSAKQKVGRRQPMVGHHIVLHILFDATHRVCVWLKTIVPDRKEPVIQVPRWALNQRPSV